jgi:hypothetical protein
MLSGAWVGFAVEAERGVITTLDQPVLPLKTILSPRLYRELLVEIALLSALLVFLFDNSRNKVGTTERPESEGAEEDKLHKLEFKI